MATFVLLDRARLSRSEVSDRFSCDLRLPRQRHCARYIFRVVVRGRGRRNQGQGRSGSSSNPVLNQNKVLLLPGHVRGLEVESPLLKSQTSCGILPLR